MKYILNFIKTFSKLFLLTFLIISLPFWIVLWIWSPGKPKPFLDEHGKTIVGSISEKIYIDINGVKQGLFIKGKDRTKPVLLYLHGGMPDYFLTANYPIKLDEDFVVIWWEQRGTGMSFQSGVKSQDINSDLLVSDAITLTNYLRKRFFQEKIYLMGHSGGTFVGMLTAAKAPELFHAYIGISQVSNQLLSEQLAYNYMLEQYKKNGNRRMVQKLETAPVIINGSISKQYLALRDHCMHELGIGTMRSMHSVLKGIFLPYLRFKEYTLKEKINLWRSKAASGVSVVWAEMISTDLNKAVSKLTIPVYFMEGIYDYTCSYALARSYFNLMDAPIKGFYTFHQSAHSPIFEEPDKMSTILQQDVCRNRIDLADRDKQ